MSSAAGPTIGAAILSATSWPWLFAVNLPLGVVVLFATRALPDVSGAARAGRNELEVDVVNLWINRMIGDEQLPEDCKWLDAETLAEWPEWFKSGKPRPSGRYTFTSCKHYTKDTPLVASGLLGPVSLKRRGGGGER
mgnify:CR=1 FL=1